MRRRVCLQLRRFAPESFEPGRSHHNQRPRDRPALVGVTVRYLSWPKYIIARGCTQGLAANLKGIFPLQNKPRLILALANVQPNARSWILCGLNQCVGSTRLLADRQEREPAALHYDMLSAEVVYRSGK